MACVNHDPNKSTGNTGCNQHRDACPSNRATSLSGSYGQSGQTIYASDVNNLLENIYAEISRWNDWNYANRSSSYSTSQGGVSTNDVINHSIITSINANLATIINFTASSDADGNNWSITNNGAEADPGQSKNSGDTIIPSTWIALLNAYNTMRQDCICNSDCHCNTVCTCYGNCDCNYSDERLKENIKLIDTMSDLNVYSYTYLWDKTKTFIGVIAQELLGTKYESALGKDSNGFYFVDYSQLPVKFKEV
jgi:hypothetical protein